MTLRKNSNNRCRDRGEREGKEGREGGGSREKREGGERERD